MAEQPAAAQAIATSAVPVRPDRTTAQRYHYRASCGHRRAIIAAITELFADDWPVA